MNRNKIEEANRFLIGINETELDTKVYRFISFDNLAEILLFKRLSFPRINCWDDPYENYFFKTKVLFNESDISSSLEEITTRLYGQCWTLSPESDALWRIYSSENKGVRISTTLRKLYELTSYSESINDSICIGRVNYQSIVEIEDSVKSCKHFTSMNSTFFFNSTLIKRNEFIHENEVRIIYSAGLDFKHDFKHYEIIPSSLIDSILLDPRISKRYEDLYRAAINSMGYENEVKKSRLYEFEKLTITVS